jgi:hypothetical protein
MEVSGQSHTPAAYLRRKSIRYQFIRRLAGPRRRSGPFEEYIDLPGIEPRIFDCPDRCLVTTLTACHLLIQQTSRVSQNTLTKYFIKSWL